jgi:hypothetical protein
MRRIYNIILLVIAVALTCMYTSCSKNEDLPNDGEPRIRYVRITDPAASDSLLVGAYQGNLIAIMGENLKKAKEIWFNDQRANLTSTYITDQTILVSVPSEIPLEITNLLKIVFSNGKVIEHNFNVQISEPLVNSMKSEFVLTGDIATIRGDYFYEPLTVKFTGGVLGEVVSVEDKIIQVRIPQGTLSGPITITTNFGETQSNFWFRDNRNIFISSDPFTGWWNESLVITDPNGDDPVPINGNYIRVNRVIASWSWFEVAGGPASAMGDISKNVPDEAILKPADYNLKFEVNTKKPYNANVLKINVGLLSEFNDEFRWLPPYDTQGEWQTVVIPFETVIESYKNGGAVVAINPDGYWTRLLFHGGGELDCDMSFDNFRVVPKVIKK